MKDEIKAIVLEAHVGGEKVAFASCLELCQRAANAYQSSGQTAQAEGAMKCVELVASMRSSLFDVSSTRTNP